MSRKKKPSAEAGVRDMRRRGTRPLEPGRRGGSHAGARQAIRNPAHKREEAAKEPPRSSVVDCAQAWPPVQ